MHVRSGVSLFLLGSILLLTEGASAEPQTTQTRLVAGFPVQASPPVLPTPAETTVVNTRRQVHLPLSIALSSSRALVGESARSFLQNRPDLLGLAATPPLMVQYVYTVPAAHGIPEMVYIRLVQTHQGAEVVGSQVVVTLTAASVAMFIESVETLLFPSIRTTSDSGTLDAAAASAEVLSRLQPSVSTSMLSPLGERARWLRGEWRLVQEFEIPQLALAVAVDEATTSIDVWQTRHRIDYSGTVSGRIVVFDPQSTAALTAVPFPNLSIRDGLTAVQTDAAGKFTFTTPSSAGLVVSLTGKWVNVIDQNSSPLVLTIPNATPSPLVLLFNPAGNLDTSTAQTNAYYHGNFIHDWLVDRGVHPAGIDVPLNVNVNWSHTCNSYFDGFSIHFFKAGDGCINSAYDTLIYHEYAHFVDQIVGGITDGALSEGWGDIVATYATGQSLIGEGFFTGQPASFIRNASNTYQYYSYDEVHTRGQAWMGFAWDLRQSLINQLGPGPGAALAESLVLPVFFSNSLDIPSAVRAVAVRDGLSAGAGGPHFAEILAAANKHGLGYILDIVPPTVSITSPSEGANLSGKVTIAGTARDDVSLASVVIEIDGIVLGPASGGSNWTFSLDSTLVPSGAHALTVRAIDAQGNEATASVHITIAPSGLTTFVTGVAVTGTPISLPGWVGMVVQTGPSPIVVTSLGRFYVPGNSGVHTLKLVDAVTGLDLPNGSVDVTMTRPAFSSFVYGTLAAPVTLSAGRTYYLVSQEASGDMLYDANVTVQTTAVASVAGSVSYRRSWSAVATPNRTYGPLDFKYRDQSSASPPAITSPLVANASLGVPFKYTITATNNPNTYGAAGLPTGLIVDQTSGVISGTPQTAGPFSVTLSATNTAGVGNATLALVVATTPPPLAESRFVTSMDLSRASLSNAQPNWAGMAIQMGPSPVVVTALGRFYVPGNSRLHTVKLVDGVTGADVVNGSVNITMTAPASSSFVYGTLKTPVTLSAGRVYYLVSQEDQGGDYLYDANVTVQTTGIATVLGPASYRRAWSVSAGAKQTYGPLDFKYQ